MSNTRDVVHYKLQQLSDVEADGIAPGQGLSWNGSKFVPATLGGASGTYALPTASASVKGGIQVGAGLTMTGDVLSVTGSSGSDSSGSGLGYDQTWQNMSASRTQDTIYQNTTGAPICVKITGPTQAFGGLEVSVDGTTWLETDTWDHTQSGPSSAYATLIVPPLHYYRLWHAAFDLWVELRGSGTGGTGGSTTGVSLDQGHNNIGSFCWVCLTSTQNETFNPGTTIAGNRIVPAGLLLDDHNSASFQTGSPLTGTWRILGKLTTQAYFDGTSSGTLAQRIA